MPFMKSSKGGKPPAAVVRPLATRRKLSWLPRLWWILACVLSCFGQFETHGVENRVRLPIETDAGGDSVRRPVSIDAFFSPPAALSRDFGNYRSPLKFDGGGEARSAAEWQRRRDEILRYWHGAMGAWPQLLDKPAMEFLKSEPREKFTQHRVRLEIARGQFEEGWLLIPAGVGPFPAVLVPFYEPETSTGLNTAKHRDFALQLARRGYVTLSIGSPGGDARKPDTGGARCQPLSFLAFIAANAHTALSQRPEVDPARIGVVGHSYGGKWAMFAAALYEKFACCATSDPGIVWDEARSSVNYWEPWYLGLDPNTTRRPGLITEDNPRTGAYRKLVAEGRDLHELHALIAPRPFFVSGGSEDSPERWRALNHLVNVNRILGFTNRVAMTNRPKHDPNPESNEQVYEFLARFLKP